MFDKNDCSLSKNNNSYTCYDRESLEIIANGLNKIGYKINLSLSDKKLHDTISKIINDISDCKNEACWLKWNQLIDTLNKSELKKLKSNFKPLMPEEWRKDMHTWLSTVDIDKALEEYVKDDDSFYSYGAVPIDATDPQVCYNRLCKINIDDHLKNNHTKIAIIFNTDKHNESGEHWIGFYIDIKGKNNKGTPGIYFFDSVGDDPPEQINKLTGLLIQQGKKNNINFDYYCNKHQHQKGSSECGIYSLHFINSMYNGENFKTYIKKKKNDAYINKYRTIFFVD